ncbi:MAG: hypothetical protein U0V73_16630 [Acidimicrobiia bacterium]
MRRRPEAGRRAVRGDPARDDRGFVALELVLGVGLLLFPVLMLVVSLPTWSERQTLARTAATEAARAWARAGDDLSGAADAHRVVGEIARNYDVDPAALRVAFAGSVRVRGGEVQVTVTIDMPVRAVPGIGSLGGWSWSASHTEPVDRYRSYG